MNIKNFVKDQTVEFQYFRDNTLFYQTSNGFLFPVPVDDIGTSTMKKEDKAILFMRWIRQHLKTIKEADLSPDQIEDRYQKALRFLDSSEEEKHRLIREETEAYYAK